jgi:hypothetical protein
MQTLHQTHQDHSWWACCVSSSPRGVEPGCADQVKRSAQQSQRHSYTLLLVPRVSTLVTRILEEEGVLGDVTLSAYNLQFIPLAEDVISLENDSAFREIWVVGVQVMVFELSLTHSFRYRTVTKRPFTTRHKPYSHSRSFTDSSLELSGKATTPQ